MILDEEAYLEHFGVKGMKWGVIRERRRAKLAAMTPKQRDERRERNQAIVATTAWAVFGALYVAALVASDGGRPPPRTAGGQARSGARQATKTVSDIINEERNVKISAIKRTYKEGHMDKGQMETFLSSLNKRYDRKILDAMKS